MNTECIVIKGAREHNLKSIDLTLPRNKLIVITGLSGSGKSSLAFDTIYAEGQRRYVESLSAYARQFLEQLQKPDVDFIEGLSPAIAIEQRKAGSNPRSTVATQTEIYDYLRLLFARIGVPYCHRCGRQITRQSTQQIVTKILEQYQGKKIILLAPVIRGKKGEYQKVFDGLQKLGFVRARVDGNIVDLSQKINLHKNKKHELEVVVDRIVIDAAVKKRLTDSMETALKTGSGIIIVSDGKKDTLFSQLFACVQCNINIEELEPRMFSFNSPYGACPACNGMGTKMEIDKDLVVPDKNKTIREGAVAAWRRGGRGYIQYYRALLYELSEKAKFDLDTPFKRLNKKTQRLLLYGGDVWVWDKRFEGVIPNLERIFGQTDSNYLKEEIVKFMSDQPCPQCAGRRLRPESLAVKVNNCSIYDLCNLSISASLRFLDNLELAEDETLIANQILKELRQRLSFLTNVGLDYLTLNRASSTLSGGEAQRIRLATQIGSGLVGVVYILDEPSIGLHQRDNQKLLDTLKALRDLGNTLVVVEHDETTIRSADHIVDLGPAAGKNGGQVICSGTIDDLLKNKASITAQYLNREVSIPLPIRRREYCHKKKLVVLGATEHNLKNIDINFPLGLFICVTGVSGSGKSTLIYDVLYQALIKRLYRSKITEGKHREIKGIEFIDKVIVIDQSPIGRTPRSNPVTYTGVFTFIRDLFARLPESKIRGFKPGRFSFNVKGGRCDACMGDGIKKIEMHFLPDVYVQCEVCKGKRYNDQTLEIKYKGRSIADVLSMSVSEGLKLFENIPQIKSKLEVLDKVGLGYLELGQSATTLSGGEAQRIKLSAELSRRSTGRTLYILDEPTTGLHFADIHRLLEVLQALVDAKNTVVIIEHNLDVVKSADYIIDLGPEGGDQGGYLVANGTIEDIMHNKNSYTGKYLKKYLNK
ncbi:MAG: excinuclease ABC subunit UvrA [Candidatus Omnitrophota bacterium]